MTENETIELLKSMQSPLKDYAELVGAPAFTYGHKYVYPYLEDYAIEEAIEALKEVQQYRKIGTVEECKKQKENLSVAYRIISDYESIGTVGECREAVEKQKAKNPVKDKYHHNCCPNCGWIVSGEGGYGEEFCPHCENCGQAIRWVNENLEGMEE